MEKSESDFWWGIKGICILAVIGIHSFMNTEITVKVVWIRQFINFPVILFVFLAGYFVKIDQVSADWKGWIQKRFIRIVGPYLLCSFFYLLYSYFVKGSNLNYKGVIASLVLGTSNVQMYYCIVMLQLILLTPVLVKYQSKRWIYWGCFLITFLSLILIYLKIAINSFCGVWLSFYVYGMYCAKVRQASQREPLKKALSLLVGAAIFVAAETWAMWNTEAYYRYSISQVRVSNFVLGFALIKILLPVSKMDIKCSKGLIFIGRRSFAIYLIHMFVMDTLLFFSPDLHYLVVWIVTVAASCALCFAVVPLFERLRRLMKCKKPV